MLLLPTHKYFLVVFISIFLLSGCISGNNQVRPDAKSGYISVGKVNNSDVAVAQNKIESLLYSHNITTTSQRQSEWQELLNSYTSRDNKFELAVLTALALEQLSNNQQHSFLITARKISDQIDQYSALPPETELVLIVAQYIDPSEETPYNPSIDKSRVTLAVETLLSE